MKKFLAGLLLTTLPFAALAVAQNAEQDAKIKAAFAEVGLKVNSVADSTVPGLLQVLTDQGLFFATQDGGYLIEGQVYNLNQKVLVNDLIMRGVRKEGVTAQAASIIEFKAPKEKHVINVFTDISCGYCRKLHNEMQSYLDAGITVRYLAFPRGGLNSDTFTALQSVWCSKDKLEAMNKAKSGAEVTPASCQSPVAAHYKLGQSFGISGTPAIVLPDGQLIPGYQSAAQLTEIFAKQPKT
jgi:thiol:disulfide interchange protein DsbC